MLDSGSLRLYDKMIRRKESVSLISGHRFVLSQPLHIHPARLPGALPEFFVKLLTDESDIVYDPFAGSNTTGAVAEKLERRWLASENIQDYLEASKFRFE